MQRRWYVAGAAILAASAIVHVQLNRQNSTGSTANVETVPAPVPDQALPGMVLPNAPLSTESRPPAPSLEVEIERPGQRKSPALAAILAAARKKVGRQPPYPVFLEGEFTTGPQRLPVTLTYEKGGRYRLQLSGTEQVTAGFDGQRSWTVSSSETADEGALVDGRLPALATWVLTGAWLQAKGPCAVQSLEESHQAGIITLTLRARNSQDLARLILDRRTYRPTTLVLGYPAPDEIWHFDDYRTALGVTLPYRLTQTRETGTASYRFTRLSAAPPFTRNPFHLALEAPIAAPGEAVAEGQRANGPKKAPQSPTSPAEPRRPEAMPPCEPQVAEHLPGDRKGPAQPDRAAPVARMNTELAPTMEPGSPADELPLPVPKPARPDQEKPTLNGFGAEVGQVPPA